MGACGGLSTQAGVFCRLAGRTRDAGFGLVEIHKLYECLDLPTCHKSTLLLNLERSWVDLDNAGFEVLLNELTSTHINTSELGRPFRA